MFLLVFVIMGRVCTLWCETPFFVGCLRSYSSYKSYIMIRRHFNHSNTFRWGTDISTTILIGDVIQIILTFLKEDAPPNQPESGMGHNNDNHTTNDHDPVEPCRDVTLRGVDSHLYDEFTRLAKSHGETVGSFFNSLVEQAQSPLSLRFMFRRGHGSRRWPRHGRKPEIIGHLKELQVDAKTLCEAGDNISYVFRHIDKLIFDKTVTAEMLSKHVRTIRGCKSVEMRGKVSKLLRLGLVHDFPTYKYPSKPSQLKDITIRRVSERLYDAFAGRAKEEGKSYGEYFSMLLSHLIHVTTVHSILAHCDCRRPLVISQVPEITVTVEDLEPLRDRDMVFYGIEELTFSDEISTELFMDTIKKIVKCGVVKLPAAVSRLVGIARTSDCREIRHRNELISLAAESNGN